VSAFGDHEDLFKADWIGDPSYLKQAPQLTTRTRSRTTSPPPCPATRTPADSATAGDSNSIGSTRGSLDLADLVPPRLGSYPVLQACH
jgi:hypothetical protein